MIFLQSRVLVVVLTVVAIGGVILAADCDNPHPIPNEMCYQYVDCWEEDEGCIVIDPGIEYIRIKENNTDYVCTDEGIETTYGRRCDKDTNNRTNLCGKFDRYDSGADCNAGVNPAESDIKKWTWEICTYSEVCS